MKTKNAKVKSDVDVDVDEASAVEAAANEPATAIAIDKDIAMPTFAAPRRSKYPFADMAIGDSFAFPPEIKVGSAHSIVSARNRRQPDRRFRVKKTDDAVRCWRTA
jgi:hypothetical protein